jgi:tetratricopeptide (TPR) repeat protein
VNNQNGYFTPATGLLLGAGLLFAIVLALLIRVEHLAANTEQTLASLKNLETLQIEVIDAAEIDAIYERITEAENRALGYLGIFEGIGFAFTALGILFTFVGIVAGFKYDESIKQMDKSLQRMNEIDAQFQSRHRILRESGLAQSLMHLAERQYKARDIEGALQTYQRALDFDGNNPVVYYYIGYIQTQKNMLIQARDTLHKAMELEPLPQIQAALGYVYRRIGDDADKKGNYPRRNEYYKLADNYLNEALDASSWLVDVDGESWYGSLAGLHKRLGNLGDQETPEQEREHLRQARSHYEQAAAITPLSSYPKFNIAMMTLRLDGVEAAKAKFQETKKIIAKELQSEHDAYWPWANHLLTKIALQEYDDDLNDTIDSLCQLIPPEAKDVKPRIVEDIRQIQKIFEANGKDIHAFEDLIQQLNETS